MDRRQQVVTPDHLVDGGSGYSDQLADLRDAKQLHGRVVHASSTLCEAAPHAMGAALTAAEAAHLVVVPCRPSVADVTGIGATIDLAREANRTATAVLNAAPVRNPPSASAGVQQGIPQSLVDCLPDNQKMNGDADGPP